MSSDFFALMIWPGSLPVCSAAQRAVGELVI